MGTNVFVKDHRHIFLEPRLKNIILVRVVLIYGNPPLDKTPNVSNASKTTSTPLSSDEFDYNTYWFRYT